MSDETINSHDGKTFTAYVAQPVRTPAPGLILIQYICGVNRVMRSLADGFAREGYVVVVPDLFWRQEPGLQLVQNPSNPNPEEMKRALELNDGFQDELATRDLASALAYLRAHPACNGRVGTLGYCLGGRMAFLMAGSTDVDCAVSYYGINLDRNLGIASSITRPLLMHIAEEDTLVPPSTRQAIIDGLSSKSNVTIRVHPGVNHAFALPGGPNWNVEAAGRANAESKSFLEKHLKS